eukprot:3707235-Amphidinium_carterae.1
MLTANLFKFLLDLPEDLSQAQQAIICREPKTHMETSNRCNKHNVSQKGMKLSKCFVPLSFGVLSQRVSRSIYVGILYALELKANYGQATAQTDVHALRQWSMA